MRGDGTNWEACDAVRCCLCSEWVSLERAERVEVDGSIAYLCEECWSDNGADELRVAAG